MKREVKWEDIAEDHNKWLLDNSPETFKREYQCTFSYEAEDRLAKELPDEPQP